MQRDWEPEELIAGWTLVEEDQRLVGNKTGPSRLGFASLINSVQRAETASATPTLKCSRSSTPAHCSMRQPASRRGTERGTKTGNRKDGSRPGGDTDHEQDTKLD